MNDDAKYRRIETKFVTIIEPADAPKRTYTVILDTPEAQDRRRFLWFVSIILSALGIVAWALYVDPDEGFNRFKQYGWSWPVLEPLLVILAFVAVAILALWLIFRHAR